MKHKFLSGIATAALAAVMCIGFVGCGGGAASIKGEEVTQEQWTAAFSDETFSNYKLTAKATAEEKEGDKSGKTNSEVTVTVADKKEHIVMKSSAEGNAYSEDALKEMNREEEFYVDGTGIVPVCYAKNEDGKWEKTPSGMTASSIVGVVKACALFYGQFEYSEEKEGYVLKAAAQLPSGSGDMLKNAVLKFKDGKLAGFVVEYNDEEDGDYSKMVQDYLFTYGGQKVELPSIEK